MQIIFKLVIILQNESFFQVTIHHSLAVELFQNYIFVFLIDLVAKLLWVGFLDWYWMLLLTLALNEIDC